jgi:murein DD-endopeptidase MepM/ murein hydrolase activator NlpD
MRRLTVLLGIGILMIPVIASAWRYPVTPYVPGSYAGRSFFYDSDHLGEDVLLAEGAAVRAIGSGTIKVYRSATGYGELVVVIEHSLGNNFTFKNAYGQDVVTGTIIEVLSEVVDRVA